MKNRSNLSIRELTEIIRNCDSSQEIEQLTLVLHGEFENYSISDQSFLLALIGVTLMNVTAGSTSDSHFRLNLPKLLSQVNWNRMNDI